MPKIHTDAITIDISKPGRYRFTVNCTKQRRRPWRTAWNIARLGTIARESARTGSDDSSSNRVEFHDGGSSSVASKPVD